MFKKIKVVDVVSQEARNEEQEPSVNEVHEVDEVNEVNEPDKVTNESPLNELPDIPKPKAKAKPRAKTKTKKEQIEVQPEIQEEPKVEEPKVEEAKVEEKQEPKNGKVKKVIEQVKCPKCDKLMSSKSLRYTHEQNCKGAVVKTEDLPVKRRLKKEPPTSHVEPIQINKEQNKNNDKKEIYNKIVSKNMNTVNEIVIPEHLKQEVLNTIQRTQLRMKMKEDNLNKLRMNIA